MWETWVRSLDWEDTLEKGMAIHSSILAGRITWTEEPGGLQSMGWQRVGHDWATKPPNPIREGETKDVHIQERPHQFGEVPIRLFKAGWHRFSSDGDGERYKTGIQSGHRERGLRQQWLGQVSSWVMCCKGMCRREMGVKVKYLGTTSYREGAAGRGTGISNLSIPKNLPQEPCKIC